MDLAVALGIAVSIALMVGIPIMRARIDAAAGVLARFSDLEVTATELWTRERRIPLDGLTARVEDAGHGRSVYLHIAGPGGFMLLRELPYRRSPRAGWDARKLAAFVNRASTL